MLKILTNVKSNVKKILNNVKKEKDVIEIKDIPKDGLDSILKFIYTNNINITSKNIHDILHAATFLQVS